PLAHENLGVYFVYGADTVASANVVTLQEALDRELAVVHETSDVNTLAVENRSPDCELFIQSGDIVKGGKQDRMIATDMLVPPGSGRVALPAHCVEQGRWTNRGAEDARRFAKSDAFAAGKELKYANALGQQAAVWQTVSENQGKLRMNVAASVTENVSPTSFQLTVEAPAIKAKVAEYEAVLRTAGERKNVLGVVFVVNGQVAGAEVYGSNALFRKAWPKLLNAAAVEAVAERTGTSAAQLPTARAIERFLARGAEPEPVDTVVAANRESRARIADGVTLQLLRRGGGRAAAFAVNQEEEVLQTEGGRELAQTEGLVPNTEAQRAISQAQQQLLGRSANSAAGHAGSIQTASPQAAQVAPNAPPLPPPAEFVNPTAQPNPADTNRVGRIVIQGNEHTGNRVQMTQPNVPAGQPAPPVNPNGNRLNSNRTESHSTLMVESRDPARQNAVIHRSYIRK
ncbi:MAG TPA: DUF6569 family protein, partial [Gemmata sp.]